MSRTPEVIISTPRKLLRDALGVTAVLFVAVSAVSLMAGAGGLLTLLIGFALAIAADRTKYKMVKKIELGGFEWQ